MDHNVASPSRFHITATGIAEGLDRERFSSAQLVKAYIVCVREVDDEFRLVVQLDAEALSLALQLDDELKVLGR